MYVFFILSALIHITIAMVVMAIIKARLPEGMPPGPRRSLFIGNLSLTYRNDKFHMTLHRLAKVYGSLFSLQMGWYPVVVISDINTLKEALVTNGDIFNDRPMHMSYLRMLGRGNGLTIQNGENWKELRKLMMINLREFGVRKVALETHIELEVVALLQEVNKHQGKPFKTEILFHKAVSNIICCMLFGKRHHYHDTEYVKLLSGLEFVFTTGGFQNPYVFLPYITYITIPFTQPMVFESIKQVRAIENFIKKRTEEHRQTFETGCLRDFVDIYLDRAQHQGKSKIYTEENLQQVLLDIFIAGTEIISQTLKWTFYFLIKYPWVQDRCRQEIMQVVGEDQLVTPQLRANLPYIEATLSEVLRLSASMGVFHNVKETIKFKGYTLPKNTIVFTNLYSIHLNPDQWTDPHLFNPDRFLDEQGKYQRHESFVPFGKGKRSCPGENLGHQEMFIFLTSLLQKYTFSSVIPPSNLPSASDATLGITLSAPEYELLAKPLRWNVINLDNEVIQ